MYQCWTRCYLRLTGCMCSTQHHAVMWYGAAQALLVPVPAEIPSKQLNQDHPCHLAVTTLLGLIGAGLQKALRHRNARHTHTCIASLCCLLICILPSWQQDGSRQHAANHSHQFPCLCAACCPPPFPLHTCLQATRSIHATANSTRLSQLEPFRPNPLRKRSLSSRPIHHPAAAMDAVSVTGSLAPTHLL